MSEYILNWQSQGVEGIPGKSNIALAEETTDSSSSSLVLTGKLLQNYGRIQQENFMHLLENFASANPPSNPTVGQLWFKANSNSLYLLSSSALMGSEPEYRPVGQNVSWLRVLLDVNGLVKIGSGSSSSVVRLNLNGGTDSNTGAYVAIQKAGTNIGYFGDTGALESNTSTDLGVWASTGKALRLYTNGLEQLRIDSAGRVGIGTSSPSTRLHVVAPGEQVKIQGSGDSDAILSMQPSGSAVYNWIRLYSADGSTNASITSHSGSALYFTSGPNGDLNYRASGTGKHLWFCNEAGGSATERMRLDNSGNLGIGTNSPSARLHVAGNDSSNQVPDIQITRSSSGTGVQTGPNITLKDGTTANSIALQATQGRFGVWNYGGGSWNERFAINASGAFGLNGTNYGSAGQVLTSGGSGAPPTWTTVTSGGGGGGTVTSISGSGGSTGLSLSGGPITSSGTLTLGGTLAIGSGGTGQTTANASFNALAPSQAGNSGKFLTTDGTNTSWATVATGGGGSGTVTSIAVSGGSTGLTTSGGPVTSSGTITLGGTLAVAAGGTGQTTAQAALNTLAGGVTNNRVLIGNGSAITLGQISLTSDAVTGTLPISAGGTGQATAGAAINALVPSQTGNSGKYLTTDGSVVSWGAGPGAGSEISSLTVFDYTTSARATIGPSDRYCIFVGASGAQTWQVALPNPATSTGRLITIKNGGETDLLGLSSDFTTAVLNIMPWTSGVGTYTPSTPTNEIITVAYNWVTLISNGTYWIPIMRGS